ncbi:LysR family transcriptional regulator [Wukongibacter sp. M2B1]|uniref:LysR family transcriptional regulator n=1 Tax=Wukongibacter sp. M2B1 TaxID=3088895 RepID=UPI003D78C6AB
MHIECFEYFYKVATVKSISKVAKSAHISQSALSQQIQKLEDSLGFKLLERSNKGVRLTEMGNIALKYSDNITRTYKTMIEELENAKRKKQILRIEAVFPIANYALPCTLYETKEKFQNHNYDLVSNFSENIKQNVLNNICDMGFIYGKPSDDSFSYFKVGTDKIVLVASMDYKIQDEISTRELMEYPLITLKEETEIEEKLKKNIENLGYNFEGLNTLFDLHSIEAVKASVLKGYGISFLSYLTIKQEIYKKQIKVIDFKDFSLDCDVYLITKKDSHSNELANEFIQYFKKIGQKSFC